jgi:hypothetical protein
VITSIDAPGAERDRCEAFVADVYARTYGARVSHFLPLLLGLGSSCAGLQGVIGARPGRRPGPLFLEQYLERPVERALSDRLGAGVRRDELVEVGNLASAGGGRLGPALITTLAAWLDGAGMPWAVFTATRGLRTLFGRLGIRLVDLASAPGERVGDQLADWGSYYETAPRVVAAEVTRVRAAGWDDPCLSVRCEPLWSRAFVEGCARAVRAGAA